MKIYLYRDGIVRFSSDRYDTKHIDNQFSHLTNTSINNNAKRTNTNAQTGQGNKWNF